MAGEQQDQLVMGRGALGLDVRENRYVIEFNVRNDEDFFHYRIDLFNNGKAVIDVIARDRDAISFDGEMVL